MERPEEGKQPNPWGRLLRLGAEEGEPHILLWKPEWTIGRRRGCDLSFPGNKLVSGDHCKIIVDEKSGQVSLQDTSTNGTVINKLKVVKKQTCPLHTGDVIYVVFRKNEPEHRAESGGLPSQGCDPAAADEEASNLVSALPGREDAPSSLSETKGQGEWEPARKKMKADGEPGLSRLLGAQPCEDAASNHEACRAAAVKPDRMEETLTCIICQELLHDCVSLQPCMHTFCAACYSGWMERSSLCPTCRCLVERICKNHILNNLVEAYLTQHPDKGRTEEDIRNMDARNKIPQDMLQPKVRRSFSDEEGSSEDLLELSDVDSESSDTSQPSIVCRQCPESRTQSQPLPCPGPESDREAPSTSARLPAAQDYVCPAQGSHVVCTCCFQPMPDRRAEREQNPQVPPQQCTACLQPFCHLYWGCARAGCFGCLAPLCELNLGDKCLDSVLNNNNYESDILKNYLAARAFTWKNLLAESLVALQRGVFLLSDYRITGNTVLCYCCGLRSFRELAYQYRQNIPASELPVAVTSRPDCYWGRNCRTQVKAHHAMKFNHICEQTRFKN
ncbi:PREDICTED: E3 ubiquitin-protein ligase CHFR isoform X2 [Chrysochloris asiatica]|uniref:E3 ubiquitin-protein ligase CHFR n=1 Tax=Chrysochloris asiatica TaxID=185453 RepID=A0A9B0U7J7_CHRAS|nr:PREDICTED: E3 ubiquitin-protein ligase CHFR isoform X2 [Chrysochloris asiatica]